LAEYSAENVFGRSLLFMYSCQNRQQVSRSGFSSVMIDLFLVASCSQPYASLQCVLKLTPGTRHSNNSNMNLCKHGLHDAPFVLTKMGRYIRLNHWIGLCSACTGGPYPLDTRKPLEHVLDGEVQLLYYLISVNKYFQFLTFLDHCWSLYSYCGSSFSLWKNLQIRKFFQLF
jgi:hypothetical protein